MAKSTPGVRYAEVERETTESNVRVVIDLDGGTRQDISTGVGFFDHMLTQLAFHGCIDLGITAEGDTYVDDHHTVEDVGIVLGKAIRDAIGEEPIERYGSTHTAMDESLVLVAIDVSGRPHVTFNVEFKRDRVGDLSTESVREFILAISRKSGLTIHVHQVASENDHHLCEAIFKGLGRALHMATRRVERRGSISTKGKTD